MLRNLLLFKLLRLFRISNELIPDEVVLDFMKFFQKADVSRDDKIAKDRDTINIIKLVKYILVTLLTTYILGLIWYRFSDYFQGLFGNEPEERFWVVEFNLRGPTYESHLGEIKSPAFRLITCMYYAMTTLATVGYGDYYPYSIAEKVFGSII